MKPSDMRPLMDPKSIAVVGASERRTRGTQVVANLLSAHFDGVIYPINPKYSKILDLACYPSIQQTPSPPDLVVVAVPADATVDVLKDSWESGIKAAVLLASGFGEAEAGGSQRADVLHALANRGMQICGANCYGLYNVSSGAAAFSGAVPEKPITGNVGLISQSGGFSNVIANPLMEDRGIGFSFIISCGNQDGLTIEDYINYLIDDAQTRVIACFVEGFKNPRALLELGRRALSVGKVIVVLKPGRSDIGKRAAQSHTGSIAGDNEVMDALLRKSGIVQTGSLNELIETIALFSMVDATHNSKRLLILTGSGGESSHSADAAEEAGLEIAPLSAQTSERLRSLLPDYGNIHNPVDGTGTMFEDGELFPRLFRTLTQEENCDALAINLSARPPAGSFAPMRNFARSMSRIGHPNDLLVVGYSSTSVGAVDRGVVMPLLESGIPFIAGTELAMRVLASLADYNERRAQLAERDPSPDTPAQSTLPKSGSMNEILITTYEESRNILGMHDIELISGRLAFSESDALRAAEEVGLPVALKIDSREISHKSDVGCVSLGVATAHDVVLAYQEIMANALRCTNESDIEGVLVQPMAPAGLEMIAGLTVDPTIGPAVLVGIGGVLAEVLDDTSLRLAPLTPDTAKQMLDELRGVSLLRGARGRHLLDEDALCDLLVKLGQLGQALEDSLRSVDLNPVIVNMQGSGLSVVDAYIELYHPPRPLGASN